MHGIPACWTRIATVYALIGGYAEVVFHVGLFVIPWLHAAQLFRKASREPVAAGN